MEDKALKRRLGLGTTEVVAPSSEVASVEIFEGRENKIGVDSSAKVVEAVVASDKALPVFRELLTHPERSLHGLASDPSGYPIGTVRAARGWDATRTPDIFRIHREHLAVFSSYKVAFLNGIAVLPEWRGKKKFEAAPGKTMTVAEALVTTMIFALDDDTEILFVSATHPAALKLFIGMRFQVIDGPTLVPSIGREVVNLALVMPGAKTGDGELARIYFRGCEERVLSDFTVEEMAGRLKLRG